MCQTCITATSKGHTKTTKKLSLRRQSKTWNPPHTAVRRTPAGTGTQSRPTRRGTGRRSGTVDWHTYCSGSHSERLRNLEGTGSGNPSGPPEENGKMWKETRNKELQVFHFNFMHIFAGLAEQCRVKAGYLNTPCMLLRSGTDRGSLWYLRRRMWF